MAENPGSKDKSYEALDFIINILREHERNLDKSIEELGTVSEQINETISELKNKVEKTEEKINSLQEEVSHLMGHLSNAPKKAFSVTVKEQSSQVQATLAMPPQVHISPALILLCKQWEDFQLLAMNAQNLSFTYKEDEKIFEAAALKENQLIKYSGVPPDFSLIFKSWLSAALGIERQNILEGSLEKPK